MAINDMFVKYRKSKSASKNDGKVDRHRGKLNRAGRGSHIACRGEDKAPVSSQSGLCLVSGTYKKSLLLISGASLEDG